MSLAMSLLTTTPPGTTLSAKPLETQPEPSVVQVSCINQFDGSLCGGRVT